MRKKGKMRFGKGGACFHGGFSPGPDLNLKRDAVLAGGGRRGDRGNRGFVGRVSPGRRHVGEHQLGDSEPDHLQKTGQKDEI